MFSHLGQFVLASAPLLGESLHLLPRLLHEEEKGSRKCVREYVIKSMREGVRGYVLKGRSPRAIALSVSARWQTRRSLSHARSHALHTLLRAPHTLLRGFRSLWHAPHFPLLAPLEPSDVSAPPSERGPPTAPITHKHMYI